MIKVQNSIYQPLSANGDGTGTISQNVNGSVTPVEFSIDAESGKTFVLTRLNVLAIDGNFNSATGYGALSALTNGIKIHVEDSEGTILKDFTQYTTIKRSYDWSLLSGVDNTFIGGAGADPLLIRWTFSRGYDNIYLNGDRGEKFVVTISDNLTGLDDQICFIQGYKIDNKSGSNKRPGA